MTHFGPNLNFSFLDILQYSEYVQLVLLVSSCDNKTQKLKKYFCDAGGRFCERNTLMLGFYEICQTSESNTFGIQQRNPSLIFTAPIVFLPLTQKTLSSFCKLSMLLIFSSLSFFFYKTHNNW